MSIKITVAGCGYVGMSLATILAKHNRVSIYDIDKNKLKLLKKNKSSINDKKIDDYIEQNDIIFEVSSSKKIFCKSEIIIISTPTDYEPNTNKFNTSSVDNLIQDAIKYSPNATIVIKSTIPIGYIDKIQKKYKNKNIFFSPEFLRENNALYDNLYPSRIVIGSKSDKAKKFGKLLVDACLKDNVDLLFVNSKEAESIKLFSNTFLAMRVAFFNELDTFAFLNNISSRNIIDGVCLDSRILHGYNNPSFGYGGYCLPKDTKQLLSNFKNIPQTLINAVVESNQIRKNFILKKIIDLKPKVVGIYRLEMKKGSNNYRNSAILDILEGLKDSELEIIIYEPSINKEKFHGCKIELDLHEFKIQSDLILANRMDMEINDVKQKIFTRDVYEDN